MFKLIRTIKRFKYTVTHIFTTGTMPEEMWDLRTYMAKFLYTRIKQFRKRTHSYPFNLTPKGWNRKLRKMERGFYKLAHWDDIISDLHDKYYNDTKKENKAIEQVDKDIKEAFRLLQVYFHDMWV